MTELVNLTRFGCTRSMAHVQKVERDAYPIVSRLRTILLIPIVQTNVEKLNSFGHVMCQIGDHIT